MKKVKITVLKTTVDNELAMEYAWRGGGYILLRRLDKDTGSSNLQL